MNMQDPQAPQQFMSTRTRADKSGAVPGLWLIAVITVLSTVVCSTWLLSDIAVAHAPGIAAGIIVSDLASVGDQEIAGALTTIGGSPAFKAGFKERNKSCPLPLAWVTVSPAAGQPKGTVRLISGSYYSPIFALSDVPVRIAVPFPSSYETGHGMLTVLHTGGGVTIALRPAWPLPAQDASVTHEVTWHFSKRCMRPNG